MKTQNTVKPAAFMLIKTDLNAFKVLGSVKQYQFVVFAETVFGPYQIAAYVEAETVEEITEFAEDLRSRRFITELDVRIVKRIPEDELLQGFKILKQQKAVLLINVNYKEEKERVVTYNLRKIPGVVWARAMWGPADIIAIVEADNPEAMRNLICDEIKTMKGVITNSTLYCY